MSIPYFTKKKEHFKSGYILNMRHSSSQQTWGKLQIKKAKNTNTLTSNLAMIYRVVWGFRKWINESICKTLNYKSTIQNTSEKLSLGNTYHE